MRPKEIIIIEDILKNKKPKACLEWGAGYSTLYFPKHLEDARWTVIEHDELWFNKIKQLIGQNSKTSIYYIPPNQQPWTDPYNNGSFSDLRDYITFPEKMNEKFDFILIDGRARKLCLISALKLLKNGGVVILHDANRRYYHEPFKLYKHQVLFTDFRHNSGGIWIGSNMLDLHNLLDVDKHKLSWRVLERISKLVRVVISSLGRRQPKNNNHDEIIILGNYEAPKESF